MPDPIIRHAIAAETEATAAAILAERMRRIGASQTALVLASIAAKRRDAAARARKQIVPWATW